MSLFGGNNMGVPEPLDLSQAMGQWGSGLSEVYKKTLQYEPLMLEHQLRMMQKSMLPMAQEQKRVQELLYPELSKMQPMLAEQAIRGMQDPISDNVLEQYISDVNGALGSNVGSPIGARTLGRELMNLRESGRDKYRNMASALMGRQPLVQPQQPQQLGYMQNYQPTNALSYIAKSYSPYASSVTSRMNMQDQLAAQRGASNMSFGSNLFGGFLSGMGSLMGGV